jgi:hypothetical protein
MNNNGRRPDNRLLKKFAGIMEVKVEGKVERIKSPLNLTLNLSLLAGRSLLNSMGE